ncbi:MAG TPA: hypothetical protein VK420_15775, partial [Longimicrobium sp.]|nr:hypothetical protein [Longimicrobium sp.]
MNGWDGWTRREPPVERLAFTQVKTLARRPQRDLELLGPRPVIRMRSGWKSWLMLGHPDAVRHVFQDN